MARTWPALASWGAGLILLAVAAGAPVWGAVPIAAWGILTFAWGVLALRAGRPVLPRATFAASLCALGVALVLTLTGAMGPVPFAALAVLHLVLAAGTGHALRRRTARQGDRPRRAGAGPVWLAVGAFAVAAVTTPALAFTEPGASAVPHGEMHGH